MTEKLEREIQILREEITKLIAIHEDVDLKVNDSLLSLPQPLQETMIALTKAGGMATATMISELTKKVRAVESQHLCTLTLLKWLTKEKRGRMTWFTIKKRR